MCHLGPRYLYIQSTHAHQPKLLRAKAFEETQKKTCNKSKKACQATAELSVTKLWDDFGVETMQHMIFFKISNRQMNDNTIQQQDGK